MSLAIYESAAQPVRSIETGDHQVEAEHEDRFLCRWFGSPNRMVQRRDSIVMLLQRNSVRWVKVRSERHQPRQSGKERRTVECDQENLLSEPNSSDAHPLTHVEQTSWPNHPAEFAQQLRL